MHAPSPPAALSELPRIAGDVLARIRARQPRVHCITNTVVQGLTANVLLAVGAVPSMTTSPDEIEYFVADADALLVNLGTSNAECRGAVEVALEVAGEKGIPWLLDPVFIDRSQPRAAYAFGLAKRKPKVVRANEVEFETLTGGKDAKSLDRFALEYSTVAARTGLVDLVTDGKKRVTIGNGHPLMPKVTGIGCAESALILALLGVEKDAFLAASAGLLIMGIAGEIAAEKAAGPGSFAVGFIDSLSALGAEQLSARAKVS